MVSLCAMPSVLAFSFFDVEHYICDVRILGLAGAKTNNSGSERACLKEVLNLPRQINWIFRSFLSP